MDLTEGRYDRQELITWWDQSALSASRVLVVGAGALGNELVKNLVLVGVGHVHVIDMDTIEVSNLSRGVFFRSGDEGRRKADVVRDRAAALNPEVSVTSDSLPIEQFGLGWLAGFDLVLAGLDNREARLTIGRACRKLGKTWVDGAIEGLQGLARVFLPDGPCYECTLGEVDRQIMAHRRSCSLLSPADLADGKVPTNATTASIIAGIQVQEAIKVLTGNTDLLALRNEAFVYQGDSLEAYRVSYSEDPWCQSHDRYGELTTVGTAGLSTLNGLVDAALPELGGFDGLDFEWEMVTERACQECGWRSDSISPLPLLPPGAGSCPHCQSAVTLAAGQSFGRDERPLNVPIGELGLPDHEVVTVRHGDTRLHFQLEDQR